MYINICCIYNVFQPRHGLGLTVPIDSQAVRSSRLIWGLIKLVLLAHAGPSFLRSLQQWQRRDLVIHHDQKPKIENVGFNIFRNHDSPWFTMIHHDSPWFGDSLYFQWNSSEHMVRARQGTCPITGAWRRCGRARFDRSLERPLRFELPKGERPQSLLQTIQFHWMMGM